jgi:tetratricopeptide (TPR) repeat protein
MRRHALCAVFFTVFLSCNSHTAADYLEQGNTAEGAGHHDAALIHFRNAIRKAPELVEPHYRLGAVLCRLGRTTEAEAALRQALLRAPGHLEANAKLADLYISAYTDKPNSRRYITEQLQIISKRLLESDPSSYDGLRIRGYSAMADRKPAEAATFFRRAAEDGGASPEAVIALAQSLAQAGQFAEAEQLSLDLIAKDKDFAPAYDSLYVQYIAANRLNDAEAVLQRKLSRFPKVSAYVLQLATFLHRYKPSSAALEQTLRVLATGEKEFPKGPLLVADFYEDRGLADKAIAMLEEAIAAGGDQEKEYRKRIASIYLQQGKRELARAAIDELAQDARGDSEVLALRAVLRLDAERPEEIATAVRELSGLVKTAPDNPLFRLFLGHAFRSVGDFASAREHYVEAAQKRAQWTPPRLSLVELSLTRRQYLEALKYADEIASYEVLSPRLRMLRSVAMVGSGLVHSARAELQKLSREFPDVPEPQLELGFVDLAQKRFTEAEERFRKLHRPGHKDLRPLAGLVEVQLAQRQVEKAIRLLEAEAPRSQNPAGVRRLLATTEARAGRTDHAIQHYHRLAGENSESFEVLFALGELYQKKNDHMQALEWLLRAQKTAPRDPRPPIWIGYSYLNMGRVLEAKKNYELGLSLDPENPLALNNLACLLSEEGNHDEALRLAQLALSKAPKHPEFRDTLAGIYLKKKLPDSALQIFKDLVADYPGESKFRYQLALLLIDRGDKAQARLELQAALDGRLSEEMSRKISVLLEKI